MNLLTKMKIGTKVGGGFAIVSTLLVGIALVSVFGVMSASNDFSEYRSMARSTSEIGRVQANLLLTRMGAKDFIIDASEQSIAQVRERAATTLRVAETARSLAARPEEVQALDRITDQMSRYVLIFEQIVSLHEQRNRIVFGTLNELGPQMRRNLQAIMDSAFEDGDATAAYYAGSAMTDLMLARLYVQRYLITNEQSAYERVQQEVQDFEVAEKTLLAELQNPTRRELAVSVDQGLEAYRLAFEDVYTVITERNRLIETELDRIGPEIAELSEQLKLANKQIQDTIGPAMENNFQAMGFIATIVSVFAIILAIVASITVSRSVTRPVGEITDAMEHLAKGKLNTIIPAQHQKDEVGVMAATLEVFKQNMIKNEELRKEREAMLEAESNREELAAAQREAEEARKREELAREERRNQEAQAQAEAQREREAQHLRAEEEKAAAIRAFAEEISELAEAAKRGDLTVQLRLDDKEGEIFLVCQSLNEMVETVRRGLDETMFVMSSFARGDLSARMVNVYEGTFRQLKDDSNKTAETLSTIVESIVASADKFNQTSVEISKGSADLAVRTEQQAASLEETAAAIEEITTAVQQSAQSALDATGLAERATGIAKEGSEAVSSVVEAINDIDKSSHEISQVTAVINDIAFQTNLLALNAAVEAARAGDAGKGFAVVAAEVRTLAQNSASAAKNIEELIHQSSAGVKNGVKLVETAGSVFIDIETAIRDLSKVIENIADASSEQSIGIREINQNVSIMDGNTQRNSSFVTSVARSAQTLEERAEHMARVMTFFSEARDSLGLDATHRSLPKPKGRIA